MLSVLMPVHNGMRTLPDCLDSWLAQQCGDFEIVVVDNGSSDGSFEWLQQRAESETSLRVLQEAAHGQSAASNRALREASGDLLVWTAQDMMVPAGFLLAHREAHRRHGRVGEALAVLGHIRYPDHCLMTPFMRCLVRETAFQFNFGQVGDPLDADPKCLYAPNFSISTLVMKRLGGFDESFPYGWQDTDLGCRLKAVGGRIVYEEALEALHDHPVEGLHYLRRMERIGRDCPRFMDKHPGALDVERVRVGVRAHFLDGRRMASAAQRLVRVAEANPDLPLPRFDAGDGVERDSLSAAWVLLMKYHLYKGIHDGGRELWGRDVWRRSTSC